LAFELARWTLRRRPGPLSAHWGFDRGTPIDRWYIDRFLESHAADIRGDVLEIGDTRYTDRWGSGVRSSDVLDATAQNPETVVANLEQPSTVPEERYDCLIVTQVLWTWRCAGTCAPHSCSCSALRATKSLLYSYAAISPRSL
jgi:hypothetical protein